MLRRLLRTVPCLVLLACSACTAPRQQPPLQPMVRAAKLGWGRTFRIERAVMQVRAVPASYAPGRPEPRLGKPGWGRVPR